MADRATRRHLVAGAAAGLGAAALAACGAAGQGAKEAPSAVGAREVTLRLWHWDSFLIEPYQRHSAELTRQYPRLRVEVEHTPKGEYVNKLVAQVAGGSPPDISQMTAEQRAERLYDRVMSLSERGIQDSVRFFAPMAVQAYSMIGELNADQRYDLGRIAIVSGEEPTARSQADTILASQPNHLLGLLLAADAAHLRNDSAQERDYIRRFVAAAPTERAKQLPEYTQHVNEIDRRLATAR